MANRHKRKEERGDLKERLCAALDISPDLLPGGFSVDIRGRNQVSIAGGGRIVLYTPKRVSIEVSGGQVTVTGKRLCCVSYLAGAVDIQGCVDAVYLDKAPSDEALTEIKTNETEGEL